MKNKDVFTVKINNKDVEVMLIKPTVSIFREAQLEYNRTYASLLNVGTLLREKLDAFLKVQGIWSDEKEQEHKKIIESLNRLELKLKRGGIKLSEARDVALEMRKLRNERLQLIGKRVEYESNTVEGQSENARFNYLVAKCALYNNTTKTVFDDVNDYLDKSGEEYTHEIASKMATFMIDIKMNDEMNLPENTFLKQWKFVDNKGRLINKESKLIDMEGRLVDEEGFLINENGEKIDKNGVLLDSEGFYNVETAPFLDDEGNPLVTVEEVKVDSNTLVDSSPKE